MQRLHLMEKMKYNNLICPLSSLILNPFLSEIWCIVKPMLNFTKEYVHQTSSNAAKNLTSPFNMNFRLQIFLSKVQEIEEENNLVFVLISEIRYKVITFPSIPSPDS